MSAEEGWTQDEAIQVQLIQKPDPLPGTSNFLRWHQPPTGQVGQHQEHAGAKMHERNMTVLRSNWLLQKICSQICRYLKTTDKIDKEGNNLQLDYY